MTDNLDAAVTRWLIEKIIAEQERQIEELTREKELAQRMAALNLRAIAELFTMLAPEQKRAAILNTSKEQTP